MSRTVHLGHASDGLLAVLGSDLDALLGQRGERREANTRQQERVHLWAHDTTNTKKKWVSRRWHQHNDADTDGTTRTSTRTHTHTHMDTHLDFLQRYPTGGVFAQQALNEVLGSGIKARRKHRRFFLCVSAASSHHGSTAQPDGLHPTNSPNRKHCNIS